MDRSSDGTLAIGTSSHSQIINIGNSGATVNIQGTTIYENTSQLQVVDPIITLNKGGTAGSASASGIELEENNIITSYAKTSGDRNGWELKAPNTAGIATITPGSGGIALNQSSHNPVTLGSFGSSPNSNAASLSTQVLTLQPADSSNPGSVSTTTQTFAGNKTFSGTIAASNLSGTNTGDITLGAVGSSPSANGASLSSQVLTLQPVDATHPGVVTTGTQTIAGSKTFSSTISGSIDGNAATVTTNANLTGVITSVGNATSIASQTGTGTKFVVDNGPTLITPNIGAATGTSLSVSGQLTSTIFTGTAPFVVSSTTQVANLNAANAGTVSTTATNSTNATFFPTFVASSSSSNQGVDTATGLTFNPSTNTLSTTTFSGALTGAASGNLKKETGDIDLTSFSLANNQAVAANVTSLAFANGSVRAFEALVSVYVNAATPLYESFKLYGIQKASSWDMSVSSVGDDSGVDFDISTSGQVTYTSGNYTGFSSGAVRFRATILSI